MILMVNERLDALVSDFVGQILKRDRMPDEVFVCQGDESSRRYIADKMSTLLGASGRIVPVYDGEQKPSQENSLVGRDVYYIDLDSFLKRLNASA